MTETQNSAIEDEDNIFKIMIASDIHLGFNEKDVIRGILLSLLSVFAISLITHTLLSLHRTR